MIRFLPHIVALLAVSGAVAWVVHLHSAVDTLTAQNAALTRSLAAMEQQAAQARSAALVARAEADRAAAKAAEYEQVKDAFRKGDFNAPLPDDFRALLDRILRPGHPPD